MHGVVVDSDGGDEEEVHDEDEKNEQFLEDEDECTYSVLGTGLC